MILLLLACTCGRDQCSDETEVEDLNPSGDGSIGWADLSALLPPCEALDAGDELDFDAVCLQDACAGDSLATIEAAWGSATSCDSTECEWSTMGVFVEFDADPNGGGAAVEFDVTESSVGRDENGLGVGATMSCFAEVLGAPDAFYLDGGTAGYHVYWLGWDAPDVDVFNHDELDWTVDHLIFE